MRRFIYKTVFLVIPIIIIAIVYECLLRNIPNDYSYKNEYFQKNAQNIETIFFGSSHTYYGINPIYFPGNSFNASHISQSIDLDYELIIKYSHKFKKLETLIIPIDYFSLFSRTSSGTEAWRMKNYNIYYNLNTSLNLKENFEFFSFSLKKNTQRIIGYYRYKKNYITCSSLGYGNVDKEQADLIETGKTAAQRHTQKDKIYLNDNISIVNNIITFAEQNNLTVLFYTSPAYYSYRTNLDCTQYHITTSTIDSICNNHNNTYYFNLIAGNNFIAEDFRDANHLNKDGAEKLTKIINEKLGKIRGERTIMNKNNNQFNNKPKVSCYK
jgi:hypothetical protein